MGPPSLINVRRLANMEKFLRNGPPGVVVEVGVFRGGSLSWLAERFPDRHFYGYDTFEGMPEAGPLDNVHKAGDFKASLESVRLALNGLTNVTLIKGVFPQSCERVAYAGPIALAHIDVDLYTSTRDAVNYLLSRMARGGRIYCDDALQSTCHGATHAFVEFCAKQNLLLELDPDAHAFTQIQHVAPSVS